MNIKINPQLLIFINVAIDIATILTLHQSTYVSQDCSVLSIIEVDQCYLFLFQWQSIIHIYFPSDLFSPSPKHSIMRKPSSPDFQYSGKEITVEIFKALSRYYTLMPLVFRQYCKSLSQKRKVRAGNLPGDNTRYREYR